MERIRPLDLRINVTSNALKLFLTGPLMGPVLIHQKALTGAAFVLFARMTQKEPAQELVIIRRTGMCCHWVCPVVK